MPKFVPRERKHKVRQRRGQDGNNGGNETSTVDSNVVEILPSSTGEKEQKRQNMRADLQAQQVSGKKRKRLDKYIVCSSL